MSMDGKAMALAAYRHVIEDIATRQHDIVLRGNVKAEFAKRALPVREFTRRLNPRQRTLAEAPRLLADEDMRDREALERLYAQAYELEAMFAQHHEAEDEVWADAMADYIRKSR